MHIDTQNTHTWCNVHADVTTMCQKNVRLLWHAFSPCYSVVTCMNVTTMIPDGQTRKGFCNDRGTNVNIQRSSKFYCTAFFLYIVGYIFARGEAFKIQFYVHVPVITVRHQLMAIACKEALQFGQLTAASLVLFLVSSVVLYVVAHHHPCAPQGSRLFHCIAVVDHIRWVAVHAVSLSNVSSLLHMPGCPLLLGPYFLSPLPISGGPPLSAPW